MASRGATLGLTSGARLIHDPDQLAAAHTFVDQLGLTNTEVPMEDEQQHDHFSIREIG